MKENTERKSYWKTEDVAHEIGCNREFVGWLRKYGILKAVKFGKRWMYRKTDVDKIWDEFDGYDLSNESAIKSAVLVKRALGGN